VVGLVDGLAVGKDPLSSLGSLRDKLQEAVGA
jgi:hypothetical protein